MRDDDGGDREEKGGVVADASQGGLLYDQRTEAVEAMKEEHREAVVSCWWKMLEGNYVLLMLSAGHFYKARVTEKSGVTKGR